jgi:hypothetical protein
MDSGDGQIAEVLAIAALQTEDMLPTSTGVIGPL